MCNPFGKCLCFFRIGGCPIYGLFHRSASLIQREYLIFEHKDPELGCDLVVRSENIHEVLTMVSDHACRIHRECDADSKLKTNLQNSIKTVWCNADGKCYNEPKIEVIPPWGYKS